MTFYSMTQVVTRQQGNAHEEKKWRLTPLKLPPSLSSKAKHGLERIDFLISALPALLANNNEPKKSMSNHLFGGPHSRKNYESTIEACAQGTLAKHKLENYKLKDSELPN